MNTARYRGDCTDFDSTSYVGADTAGAFYRPISATFRRRVHGHPVQADPAARHADLWRRSDAGDV